MVTGASSGIGRATSLAFARRGARLAVCDIDGEGLRSLQAEVEGMGGECYREVVDVAQAWQVEEFCANTYKDMGRVDVLVNNAGVACSGRFEEMSIDDWRWITGINLWGVIHGCHYFYPRMVDQGGGGHIVNISSAAALVPLPFGAAYCATKSAVLAISETLRAEAALHHIGVSAVCPGFVNTSIVRNARTAAGAIAPTGEEREKQARAWGRISAPPDKPAAAVVRAVEKNIGVVRSGFATYLGDILHRSSRGFIGFFLRAVVRVNDHFMERQAE